jgi:hypothetical protein
MNLWADFDNQHAPPESARQKLPRRLTEQTMLSSLRRWLLQDYTSSYCRSLAAMRIYRRCYWIDAWGIDTRANHLPADKQAPQEKRGARGRDKSSSHDPLLEPVLSLSQVLAQESRPIALNGIVLEAGSSRRKEVRAIDNGNTAEPSLIDAGLALPKESGVVRASWLEIAPALLKEIEHSPAIFLLNPFGHTLFTYDDLALLYSRTSAPTELFLLVPHRQAEMRLLTAAYKAQAASALTALLRTDRWKAFLPQGAITERTEETAPYIDGIIDLLLSSMQQHLPWVQPIALPLGVRPARVEVAPYTLLFATRSKDSLLSMNDAVCRYHRRLYEQSRRGVLGEEWFAMQEQQHFASEISQLCQRLLQLGQTQRTRRWPDLRQQLLLANFGQFTLDEYDELIRKLLTQGDVRCEWRRREPSADDERRVPGNDDTLLWQ